MPPSERLQPPACRPRAPGLSWDSGPPAPCQGPRPQPRQGWPSPGWEVTTGLCVELGAPRSPAVWTAWLHTGAGSRACSAGGPQESTAGCTSGRARARECPGHRRRVSSSEGGATANLRPPCTASSSAPPAADPGCEATAVRRCPEQNPPKAATPFSPFLGHRWAGTQAS